MVMAVAMLATACGSKPADPSPTPTPKASGSGAGHGHSHAGEEHALVDWTGDGWTVKATQVGDIEPKHEMVFELMVSGGEAKAVRAWVGTEDGKGSVPVKAAKEGDGWDVHLEGMAEVKDDAKLWVEIESADGKKVKASFALERDDHDHDDHDHDH
jgi:hypothetical protein